MASKKNLYHVLQVARTAPTEVINAAFEARLKELGTNAAPEVQSERNLIREAHAILSDPVRKKLYDEKLRQEAMRALYGHEEERIRPANAATHADPESSGLGRMVAAGCLALIVLTGSWIYFDHKRKSDALRIEQERVAAEQKLKEEASRKLMETVDWAKERADKDREARDFRAFQVQREREQQRYEAEQRRQVMDKQREVSDAKRAELDKQRQEQEAVRRSQSQLQREQRYLQELERNRGMKF